MASFKTTRWRPLLLLSVFVATFLVSTFFHASPVAADGESYSFQDKSTINCSGGTCTNPVGGGGTTLTGGPKTYNGSYFVGNSSKGCNYLESFTVTITGKHSGGGYDATVKASRNVTQPACGSPPTVTSPVVIADPNGVGPNGGNQGSGGSGGTGSSAPSCENTGFSLAWMFCPVIEGLAKAVDGIYSSFVQPLLVIKPLDISNSGNDPEHAYAIWSNFRIYGDIFLIVALLVIVFGQSIGGGMIDAYTAKKVLPRLIIAAIAINLSIYVVALAIDLTNVIGAGVQNLLEAPFKAPQGGWTFNLGGAGGQTGAGVGMAALVGGGIWAVFSGGALLYFLFTFVLIPAFFIFLAILATVLIRQALILFLVFTAPVAFALYCLPNTEQYFHRWWKLLLETLMVYPIIAIIFAMANILSVVVLETSSGLEKTVAVFLSIAALLAPLVMIPYSFRLAGGAIGKAHDLLTDYGKRGHQAILGNPNDPNSMRNRARYGMGDRNTQLRERAVKWGMGGGPGVGGFARRRIGAAFNYGNLQAKRSMYNKQEGERVEGQIATGDDSNVRDMFIAWDAAANGGKGGWFRRMDMERDAHGNLHAATGAKSVYGDYGTGAYAHRKAMNVHGKRNKSAFQSGLYYEWKKTSFDPAAMDRIGQQYSDILQEHGFNAAEGGEAMKAIGFRHQGQTLATKYSSYKELTEADGSKQGRWGWTYDRVGMAKEVGLNLGTGEMTRQDVSTYEQFSKGYRDVSELLSHQGSRGDDEAIPITPGTARYGQFSEYDGKTFGQLKDAKDRMRRIADTLNPNQLSPAGAGSPTPGMLAPADDHGGGGGGAGLPQSPYGGISYAPVDVQAAARRFYETVHEVDGTGPAVSTPAPPRGPA